MQSMKEDESDTEETFEGETSDWIRRIDKGGLFKVNDDTYSFFVALERRVRVCLSNHLLHLDQGGASLESLKSTIKQQKKFCRSGHYLRVT